MTFDLQRLRNYRIWNRTYKRYDAVPIVVDAATEIERLRAQVEQLKDAAEKYKAVIRDYRQRDLAANPTPPPTITSDDRNYQQGE